MTDMKTFKTRGVAGLALAGAVILSLQLPRPAQAETTQATLLDRIQIEDLMIDYYWDLTSEGRHDIDKYWAKDATFTINGEVIKGRDAIQKIYNTRTNDRVTPGGKFNMLLNNPRITVNGNMAVMDAIWTGVISDTKRATPRFVEQGTEHTQFVKQDGHWLIISRTLTSDGGMPDAYDGNPKD